LPILRRNHSDLFYTKTGAGPALLLIQGVGVIGNGWRPQIDGLADAFTVFAFDNRGIGQSGTGEGDLSIEALADDALAILDAEGVDGFHLAGHSMGGLVAQEVALRVPTRVRSLTLLCTFARGQDATALSAAMLVAGLRTRLGTKRMRRRAFLDLIMPGAGLSSSEADRLANDLAPLFGHDLADQPPIVMKQLGAARRYDASARLVALSLVPTLVVSAERDIIAKATSGRALSAAIPGSTFVELDQLGHGAPIADPARVNALIRAHCLASGRSV
jgi:aminoacrylate hydrolase